MRDTDPQPFDGDYCKHAHTRKLLSSELHQCQNCEVLLRVEVIESDDEYLATITPSR